MKYPLLLALCVALSTTARAELSKIGNDADYTLTDINQFGFLAGATSGSNLTPGQNTTFSGGYFMTAKDSKLDWDSGTADFSARLKAIVLSDGWTMVNFEPKNLENFPYHLSVLAKRDGHYLLIEIHMFALSGNRFGISYNQSRN
ncbi:MAG TPA: hypothetical protein VIJ19_10000 [Opitutaceae bacterium]